MKRSRAAIKPSMAIPPSVGSYRMVYMNEGSDLLKAYLTKVSSTSTRRQRGGDNKVTAQILSRRLVKNRESTGSLTSIADEELTAFDYDYYVHFVDFESRLDQWIGIDRLDLDTVVEPPSPKKKSKLDYNSIHNDYGNISTGIYSADGGSPGGSSSNGNGSSGGTGKLVSSNYEFGGLSQSQSQQDPLTQYTKNISLVHVGNEWRSDAWYFSPYRNEDINKNSQSIYLCSWCLKPFNKQKSVGLHECGRHCPPGVRIYSDPIAALEVYKINGAIITHKAYCQNLSLLAKLFLEHKSVHYNVETFLFYVLCEVDHTGSHIVGYFSREKRSPMSYNLACILVLPPHQKKGYGKFLISLSYELSRRRKNFKASPEKPLSDLAQICYRRYWTYMVVRTVLGHMHTQPYPPAIANGAGYSDSNNAQNSTSLLEPSAPYCTLEYIVLTTGISFEDILSTINDHFPAWDGGAGGNISTLSKDAKAGAGMTPSLRGQFVSDIDVRISRHTFDTSAKNLPRMMVCKPECMLAD